MSMEIPTISRDEEIEYVVIDSYELLKVDIYEAEIKHVVILTEKIIETMPYVPAMPSHVIVEEVIPTVDYVDKAIVVKCSIREDCLNALLNIVNEEYNNGIYILEVWIMCPEMRENHLSVYKTDEWGEIIHERLVMV